MIDTVIEAEQQQQLTEELEEMSGLGEDSLAALAAEAETEGRNPNSTPPPNSTPTPTPNTAPSNPKPLAAATAVAPSPTPAPNPLAAAASAAAAAKEAEEEADVNMIGGLARLQQQEGPKASPMGMIAMEELTAAVGSLEEVSQTLSEISISAAVQMMEESASNTPEEAEHVHPNPPKPDAAGSASGPPVNTSSDAAAGAQCPPVNTSSDVAAVTHAVTDEESEESAAMLAMIA